MTPCQTSEQPEPERSAGDAASAESPPPPSAGAARTYRRPCLERHGRLAEVTRFGGSQIVDSGGGLGDQI